MLNLGTAYASIEVRMDRLERNLAEAERKFAATGKKIDAEAQKVKRNMEASFSSLGRALTIGLTAPLAALGTAAVKAAVDMDSLKRGLRAVTGSSAETERQLKRLQEVAKLPGLGFREAIEGATRLQAAGISAQTAERALLGFGNALATVGRGKAELDGVILALSQIQSKGKVSAEEINQIAERVPQIRRVMIDAFGTADTEIIQKAKISSKEFIEVITESLNKLPKVVGGVKNSFENFSDAANRALTAIGDTLLPAVTRALEKFTPLLESIAENFNKLPDAAKTALGGLAATGIIVGPALYGIAKLIEAIGQIRAAWLATSAAVMASPLVGLLRRLKFLAGPAALTAAGMLAPQRAGGGDVIGNQGNPAERIRTLEYSLRIARERQTEFMRPADRDRLNKTVRFIEGELAKARKAARESARSAVGSTGATDPFMNVPGLAEARQKTKDAADEAKKIAAERADVMNQLAVDRAALKDKFKAQRIKAFQELQARQARFGPGEAASGPYRVRLDEIARDEAEEKKRLAEIHKQRLADAKRRTAEIEKNAISLLRDMSQNLSAEAESLVSSFGAGGRAITKDEDDIARIMRVSEQEMAAAYARGVADQGAWLHGFTESMLNSANSIADTIQTAMVNAGNMLQRMQAGSPYMKGLMSTFMGMGQSIASTANAMGNAGDQSDRQFSIRVRRIEERLRSSFGGILGQEIAYEFTDQFARGLEKAFGSSSIGKIFSRALTRWMDSFMQGAVDRTIGGLASSLAGGGSIFGGGLFGSIGKLLGFAEGGWVPGPIGQARPAIVHGGEFVVSRKMQESGGLGGVTINMGGVTVANDYDVSRLADRLAWETKRRLAVNVGSG